MIIWTPTVLSVLYACVLYFCICTRSAQLSMFHMERRSRNTLIIIIIINIIIFINIFALYVKNCEGSWRWSNHFAFTFYGQLHPAPLPVSLSNSPLQKNKKKA